MSEPFTRTTMLFGKQNMEKLFHSKVAVFGIGGVGGHCTEALCRSGIGSIDLFDHDLVCITNINRQIIAARSTIGRYKVDVMRDRILDINPDAKVGAFRIFYDVETAQNIDLSVYDYIIDAIDTMSAKLELVCRANACGVPIISSMGAANKLDASAFEVADIFETSVCPMARIMRRELRKRNIQSLKVVYSKEPRASIHADVDTAPDSDTNSAQADAVPDTDTDSTQNVLAKITTESLLQNACDNSSESAHSDDTTIRHIQVPASNAFVPPVAGLILAGEVVKDLIK